MPLATTNFDILINQAIPIRGTWPVPLLADRADPEQWGMLDEVKQRLRDYGYRGKVIIDLDEE